MHLSLSAEQASALREFLGSRVQDLPASLAQLLPLLSPMDSNLSQSYPSPSPSLSPQPQPRPSTLSTQQSELSPLPEGTRSHSMSPSDTHPLTQDMEISLQSTPPSTHRESSTLSDQGEILKQKRKIAHSEAPETPSKRPHTEPYDNYYEIRQTRSQTRASKKATQHQEKCSCDLCVAERGGGGGSGSGGLGGRAAFLRPDCPRSAKSVRRRKEASRFTIADTAVSPPKTVADDAERLLGKIAFGPKAMLFHESCSKWIAELRQMLEGGGKALDELPTYSLGDLAKSCDRVETANCAARFVRILIELYFFSKINGLMNEEKLQNNTLRPTVAKWVKLVHKETNILESKLKSWVQAGTRWAFLAHSGSLYLLMLIAFQEEDDILRNHNTNMSVLQTMGDALRSPNNSSAAACRLVQENLLPLLTKLRDEIPMAIPTLYDCTLLETMKLPEFLDGGDIAISDCYFDSFYYHTFRPFPRDKSIWDAFLQSRASDMVLLKTDVLQMLILAPLSSSPHSSYSNAPQLSPSSSSLPPPSSLHKILKSAYTPMKSPKDYPSEYKARVEWTEQERDEALKAVLPVSLDDYFVKFQERIDSEGNLKDGSQYLKLDRNLAEGKTIQVDDSNGNLLFSLDTTMPEHLRKDLENAIEVCFRNTDGTLKEMDSWDLHENPHFHAFHFTHECKYLTHGNEAPPTAHPRMLRNAVGSKTNHSQFVCHPSKDMQKYGEEYKDICKSIGETLQWVVEKVLRLHPDLFQEVVATASLLPGNDSSPISPFTSLVININATTLVHKDGGDAGGCIVLTVGNHQGGEIVLYEPRLVLETRNGDVIAFPSDRYSHFNLHYKGKRASIVIHGDKQSVAYQQNGSGGWAANEHFSG